MFCIIKPKCISECMGGWPWKDIKKKYNVIKLYIQKVQISVWFNFWKFLYLIYILLLWNTFTLFYSNLLHCLRKQQMSFSPVIINDDFLSWNTVQGSAQCPFFLYCRWCKQEQLPSSAIGGPGSAEPGPRLPACEAHSEWTALMPPQLGSSSGPW